MTKFIDQSTVLHNILDWNIIANCLYNKNIDLISREEWIENEKFILSKRLILMQSLDLAELNTDHWILKLIRSQNIGGDQKHFQIIFQPIDILLNISDSGHTKLNSRLNNQEWQQMQNLAITYTASGNYDKLKIVSKRLSEIVKESDLNLKTN